MNLADISVPAGLIWCSPRLKWPRKKRCPSQTVLQSPLYIIQTFQRSSSYLIRISLKHVYLYNKLYSSLVKDFFKNCIAPVTTATPSTSWGLMPRGSANLQRYLKSGGGQSCLLEVDFNHSPLSPKLLELHAYIYIYTVVDFGSSKVGQPRWVLCGLYWSHASVGHWPPCFFFV